MRHGKLAPQWVHRLQWKRRVRAERSDDQPNVAFWREYLTARVGEVTKREFVGWGRCYLDLLRNSSELSRWFGPVLIIESEDDPVTPHRPSRLIPAMRVRRRSPSSIPSSIASLMRSSF